MTRRGSSGERGCVPPGAARKNYRCAGAEDTGLCPVTPWRFPSQIQVSRGRNPPAGFRGGSFWSVLFLPLGLLGSSLFLDL